jgi:hypothetical protein
MIIKLKTKSKDCKVFVEDNKKCLRSKNCNYNFNLSNGYHEVWGKDYFDNPLYSPFGSFIADIEITTICNGINGHVCNYCYKSNTPVGKNMSFETFKQIIEKINVNNQLTQIAFGLGARGVENPDLWKMCDYLRKNYIIPNGTVAQLDDDTAEKIAMNFGGCAISYHSDFEVLADTVYKLSVAKQKPNATLCQINIHYMLSKETADDCNKLFDLIKTDKRFADLNAVVLLGLKKCGRAESGFNKIEDNKFRQLVERALREKIGVGFDSCSCWKFIEHMKNIANEQRQKVSSKHDLMLVNKWQEKMEQLSEPCESALFSLYSNVNGDYYSCSFCEHKEKPIKILGQKHFIKDVWKSKIVKDRRKVLLDNIRNCPYYEV